MSRNRDNLWLTKEHGCCTEYAPLSVNTYVGKIVQSMLPRVRENIVLSMRFRLLVTPKSCDRIELIQDRLSYSGDVLPTLYIIHRSDVIQEPNK